jgi:hypothetical protein
MSITVSSTFPSRVITGNETCICGYGRETKAQYYHTVLPTEQYKFKKTEKGGRGEEQSKERALYPGRPKSPFRKLA